MRVGGHGEQARGKEEGKVERERESVGLRQAAGSPESAAAERMAAVSGCQGSAQGHQGVAYRGLCRAPV